MPGAEFGESFLPELRQILTSSSAGQVRGSDGRYRDRVRKFTDPWELTWIGYEAGRGRARLVCTLEAGGKVLTATLDAADFDARMRKNTTRTAEWNGSAKYHDMAVSASTLMQEYVLVNEPDDPEPPSGTAIPLRLP